MTTYITTEKALEQIEQAGIHVTSVTLINWCKPFNEGGYGIGVKIGGRWKVKQEELKLILEGKQWSLEEREQRRQARLEQLLQRRN